MNARRVHEESAPEPEVPSCALSEEGMHAQRDRMRRLGASVAGFESAERHITIEFQPGFDRQLLDETVAVERECCPFFRFGFDWPMRQLTVSVDDLQHRAGLDALAYALGVGQAEERPAERGSELIERFEPRVDEVRGARRATLEHGAQVVGHERGLLSDPG